MDDTISTTFAGQLGLITADQARRSGLSRDAVRHRVDRGDWDRVRPGVFRLRGTPTTWEQEVLASVLAAGDAAFASHFTALTLWGYEQFAGRPTELTVPLGRRPRTPEVVVHRSGTIEEADVRRVGGVPVLSAARTIVDVSARFDEGVLGQLVDDGLRRRVLSLSGLHAVARRLPTIATGRSPRRVADVLARRTAGFHPGDSELESRVLRTLVDAGFPEPVRQHRVRVNGRTYFVDLAYPAEQVAIEVDGFEYHRSRTDFDRDRSRQNDLVGAGWTVLRFTSRSPTTEIVGAVRRSLFGRFVGP